MAKLLHLPRPAVLLMRGALVLLAAGCADADDRECTSNKACVAAHDRAWYCDPLTWTCAYNGPDCGARVCGPAPNGRGDCGDCPEDEICSPEGACAPPPGRQPGQSCAFHDLVNVDAGACVATATCLGVEFSPESGACSAIADCEEFYPGYNPECLAGQCGASFCAEDCVQDACRTGFKPILVEERCFCAPGEGGEQPRDAACEWRAADTPVVNQGAGDCLLGLSCLGNHRPEATCQLDLDCAAPTNGDCVEQACGFSFCAAPCDAEGRCDPSHAPLEVGEECFCAPGAGTADMGEPCPFTGGVNDEAEGCLPELSCLGLPASTTTPACPGGAADCLAHIRPEWNPDCAQGHCGASFCSAPCVDGGCASGFLAQGVEEECFCAPGPPPGDSQAGDPCPFPPGVNAASSNCQVELACLGVPPQAAATCVEDQDCTQGAAPFAQPYENPDCVSGLCGLSFCAARCADQTCLAGFVPLDVQGICYCAPTE